MHHGRIASDRDCSHCACREWNVSASTCGSKVHAMCSILQSKQRDCTVSGAMVRERSTWHIYSRSSPRDDPSSTKFIGQLCNLTGEQHSDRALCKLGNQREHTDTLTGCASCMLQTLCKKAWKSEALAVRSGIKRLARQPDYEKFRCVPPAVYYRLEGGDHASLGLL